MSDAHTYEVDLTWTQERKGTLSSSVLNQRLEVATPPEFPKGMAGIWSPEHLFVAALSSCLMTTFLTIAENSKLAFISFSCGASGVMEKVEGKYLMTEVTLRPRLVIPPGVAPDRAGRILEMSEKACLISNSVKTKVHLHPEVLVSQEAPTATGPAGK